MKKKEIPKVPVIMQMEGTECGAASLAMICAYYKKWIPLAKVREDCGISRDGSNAGRIIRAAGEYGLLSKGYRMDADGLKTLTLPAILYCRQCHFTVLKGFKGNHVYLNDPECGMVTMEREEFLRFYSGIVICFEPSEEFVPGGSPESLWKFLVERLKGLRLPFFLAVFLGAVTALTGAAAPYLNQRFLSSVLPSPYGGELKIFLITAFAVFFLQFLAAAAGSLYRLRVCARMAIVSNSLFMWHVMRLPVNFFLQRSLGDLVVRQGTNEKIAGVLFTSLAPAVLNGIMSVVFAVIMFVYSPVLASVAILSVLINMGAAYFISVVRTDLMKRLARDAGMLSGYTMSGINMMETIKATGSEQHFFENWSGRYAKANTANTRFLEKNQYLSSLPGLIYRFSSLIVFTLGVIMVMRGQFTLGMLLAFQGYMGQFMQPMMQIQSTAQGILEMRTDMERVEDVLRYRPDVEEEEELPEQPFDMPKNSVEFVDVSFGYSRQEPPILERLSFSVTPGGKIAIVGISGSGKSTSAKLLAGLYQPWEGKILIGGKERKSYPRQVLTAAVAIVDQNIAMFEDSIMNNIRMWDETISDKQVYEAAIDACIHEDILKRENGYQHIVSENGRNFSGGEKQRFEIARALAKNPAILILDEATSALDANTEVQVMRSVEKRGITLVILAHRLSAIRDCDQILVLKDGKVVEAGNHEELYAAEGIYKTFITTQQGVNR